MIKRYGVLIIWFIQFSSVTQSCLTLWDPMNRSMPGLLGHHQLPEFAQTHVHWVGDAIQPSHPLSSPSPPALNLSQHQGLFKWVSSPHQVATTEWLNNKIWSSYFTLRYLFKGNENICPHIDNYANVHRSIIHNSPKLRSNTTAIN